MPVNGYKYEIAYVSGLGDIPSTESVYIFSGYYNGFDQTIYISIIDK